MAAISHVSQSGIYQHVFLVTRPGPNKMTQATATEKTAQSREGFEVDGSFPSLTIYIYINTCV